MRGIPASMAMTEIWDVIARLAEADVDWSELDTANAVTALPNGALEGAVYVVEPPLAV